VLHALVTFAAEEAEQTSHALFYVGGGLLAAWAVVVSAVGIRRHENWPASENVARAIMGVSVLLVAAAMATAVIAA